MTLITGGAHGMGAAEATFFAREGAKVAKDGRKIKAEIGHHCIRIDAGRHGLLQGWRLAARGLRRPSILTKWESLVE